MRYTRQCVAVLLVLCLVGGLVPAVARAGTGAGLSIEQLAEAHKNVQVQRLTAAMASQGWLSVDGVLIPPEIATSEAFRQGRVPVIVTVGAKSVSRYAQERQKSIGELTSAERRSAEASVKGAQLAVASQLEGLGVRLGNVRQFGLLVAGFSAVVPLSELKTMAAVVGAGNIHVQRLYTIKDTFSNAMIKADATWADPGVNGDGAVVGVVDTGVDYTHPDFGGDGTDQGFPTDKIVAGYDFAGDNAAAIDDPSLLSPDEDPMDSNGHGTHVSGIIAADGEVTGVAPKASIVIAKIVPGGVGSAYTESIVAAFEYMADPGNEDGGMEGGHPPVTAINMSFGSPSGFVDPSDPENIAIEACIANGIVVSLSAGNDGAGDTTYADYATVGSPSVTPGSLSVASVENTVATNFVLHESSTDKDYAYDAGSTSPVIHMTLTGTYTYVYCGLGLDSSYFPTTVAPNTLALVRRGTNSFADKVNNAEAAGFTGIIVYNNVPGTISMDTTGATLPSLSITAADGAALKGQIVGITESGGKPTTWPISSGTVTFPATPVEFANQLANTVSDFSSWGPPPDLSFKPDLAAPGGNIWSTVPVGMGSYANHSGTSMAAPHVAGAAALVRLANPSWTVSQTKLALSNTATLLRDPGSTDGSYYSPRLVGAGLINVQNAAKTRVLAKRTGLETGSVALGSIEDWNTNPVTFSLTVENFGSDSATYATSGTVQWTDRATIAAHAIPGATITVSPSSITVPAGQTRNVTVTVNATGVIPSSAYHPYLEGYVSFAATSGTTIDLHVPYMGYLGNWNDFNPVDAQFNPLVQPPVAGESDTWLYNYDFYMYGGFGYPQGYLIPMGYTFDGALSQSAVAIHALRPGDDPDDYYDGYNYLPTYGVLAGLNLLRNFDHLALTIENSSGTVVRHITDIGIDTLEQMNKGLWINDYVLWDWQGKDDSDNVVADGQYYVVARATPQKVVNKLTGDSDQIVRMPVAVDTVAPIVSITDIVPSGDVQTVRWTTTDAAPSSGIYGYELYWSTNGWEDYDVVRLGPQQTSFDAVPRGAEVDLMVVDYAGNWGEDYATPQDVVISSTLPSTVLIGTTTQYTMTTTNWGVENFAPVRYDGTINTPAAWQTSSLLLEYYEQADTSWHTLPLSGADGTFTFSFGPHAGFTLPAGASLTTQLRVTVALGSAPGQVTFGMDLNQLDGSALPVGVPVATFAGSTYAISAPLDIAVSPEPLPTGHTNTLYPGAQFKATGGVGAPYSFTATGIPAGMTLTAAGALAGSPTSVGDYTLHVTVSNAGGALTYGEDFALHVVAGPGVTIGWEPLQGGTVTGNRSPADGATESYLAVAASGWAVGTVYWNGAPTYVRAPGSADPIGGRTFSFGPLYGSNVLHIVFDPSVTISVVGKGGTITPAGGFVTYHSSPAYTAKADPGYMLDSVIVDGVEQKGAANKLAYTVTFPSIDTCHAVSASFKPIPDVVPPTITLPKFGTFAGVTGWVDGAVQTFYVKSTPFALQFTLEDNSGTAKWTIKVNGRVVVDPVGAGVINYMLALTEGRNDVELSATDSAGNWTYQKLVIYLDTMPPALQVDALPSSVTSSTLSVSGSAVDAVSGLAYFAINGEPVTPYLDGSFSEKLTLAKGVNTVVVEAIDNVGNTTSQTFAVTYGTPSSSAPSSLYVLLKVGSAEMEVNGMARALDAAPFIKDGRTLLPIRALIETLGGTVQWNAQTKTATVALGSRTVALTVGSTKALVNGSPVTLDVAPMIVKGRTFLPLRAVAENLGLDLAWDAGTQTISLTYWP